MKRLIILFLLLSACSNTEQPPQNLLSKPQMVDVLVDIHIAEAKANRIQLRSYDSTQAYYRKLEREVFETHKVDTAVYRRSYRYYMNHTKELDEIYTAVVDSLSLRESIGKLE